MPIESKELIRKLARNISSTSGVLLLTKELIYIYRYGSVYILCI